MRLSVASKLLGLLLVEPYYLCIADNEKRDKLLENNDRLARAVTENRLFEPSKLSRHQEAPTGGATHKAKLPVSTSAGNPEGPSLDVGVLTNSRELGVKVTLSDYGVETRGFGGRRKRRYRRGKRGKRGKGKGKGRGYYYYGKGKGKGRLPKGKGKGATPVPAPTAAPTTPLPCDQFETSAQLQDAVSSTPAGGTIALCSGSFDFSDGGGGAVILDKDLTFACPNGGCVFVGAGDSRLFIIDDGTTSFNGEFTFQDGNASPGGQGGAIVIQSGATLNINGPNCTFSGNTAFYAGGAIFNRGTATIMGCDFINNEAGNYGGAIFNYGTATITGCDFINNDALDVGGAIDNSGTATVDDSTFRDNSANNGGADIFDRGTTNCNYASNEFCNGMGTNFPLGRCAPYATYTTPATCSV